MAHKEGISLFSREAYPSFYDDPDAHLRACLNTPAEWWFATGDDNKPAQVDKAKACCKRCPLLIRCRNWALSRPVAEVHGVWGGMTQYEREQERQKTKSVNCPRCNRWTRMTRGVLSSHKRLKGFGGEWVWCE
jgi:Zn finger protein HypA/HybF involved in hydrogenase expression